MVEIGFERSRFSKSLVRVYAGFTLGDPVANDNFLGHSRLLAIDDIGGPVVMVSDRQIAADIFGRFRYYWQDQLVLITLNYGRGYGGGWQRLIKETSQKYGSPSRENTQSAVWNDGHTVFVLAQQLSEYISTSLGDVVFLLRFFDLRILPLPDQFAESDNQLNILTPDCVKFAGQDYRF